MVDPTFHDRDKTAMRDILHSRSILPLTLDQVCFQAGGKKLIKDVSLQFGEKGCSVIIGPNGAGKTLLLRLMHGLIKPSAGEIAWSHPDQDTVKQRQAMIFQRPVMLRRSVWANVDFALKIRKIPKEDRTQLVHEALARTGLNRHKEKPARILSFGEQQRLAMARVWALGPEILFMDEASASLDPPAAFLLEELVDDLKKRGVRIIMTTHDLGQARRLGDEIIFMHRGRIKERAATDTFFEGPENDLAQAFLRGDLLWWRKKEKPKD